MDSDRQVPASFGPRQPETSTIVKRFDTPDRVVTFDNGRLEVITFGGRLIGRGSYGAGWRWSHVARLPARGERQPDHIGVLLSGRQGHHRRGRRDRPDTRRLLPYRERVRRLGRRPSPLRGPIHQRRRGADQPIASGVITKLER